MSSSSALTAIRTDEALRLIRTTSPGDLDALLDRAAEARAARFGRQVDLCAIVSAKSGLCSEDCTFCAQSSQSLGSGVAIHGMLPARRLIEQAARAEEAGATSFSLVTSGRRIASESEMGELEAALHGICERTKLLPCASLGFTDEIRLRRLARAGLRRYHHNLEAARSFFPSLCTTHTFDLKVATLTAARKVGLSLCSGGIFGVGESPEARVELAEALQRFHVDAVPINFLDARPGTPLEHQPRLTPEACLATIAVFRLMLPHAEIIVMGGREAQLAGRQSEIFHAGASATLVGDYLTTPGSAPQDIRGMVAEQGYSLRSASRTARGRATH
jgi:biotin synthase